MLKGATAGAKGHTRRQTLLSTSTTLSTYKQDRTDKDKDKENEQPTTLLPRTLKRTQSAGHGVSLRTPNTMNNTMNNNDHDPKTVKIRAMTSYMKKKSSTAEITSSLDPPTRDLSRPKSGAFDDSFAGHNFPVDTLPNLTMKEARKNISHRIKIRNW